MLSADPPPQLKRPPLGRTREECPLTSFDTSQIDAALTRLGEQAESLGVRSLPPAERNLLVATTGYGLICNGGFAYLYESFLEIDLLVEAFTALGLLEAAEACRQSNAAFPKGQPFFELDDQVRWLESLDPTSSPELQLWDRLSSTIDRIAPAVWDQKVFEYVREHPQILEA